MRIQIYVDHTGLNLSNTGAYLCLGEVHYGMAIVGPTTGNMMAEETRLHSRIVQTILLLLCR